ncbi:MAG: hypothetical protein ACRC6X_08090 [Culicoidibacterales bacterium]
MKKIGLLCLLVLSLLGGCAKISTIDKISMTLQESLPVLSDAKVGPADLASVSSYYEVENNYWQKAAADKTLLKKYAQGTAAKRDVTGFVHTKLVEGQTQVNYVGMQKLGEVEGVFIYEFLADVLLSQQQIKDANELTTLLVEEKNEGEFFFVEGKYLATVDTSFSANQREEIMLKLAEIID